MPLPKKYAQIRASQVQQVNGSQIARKHLLNQVVHKRRKPDPISSPPISAEKVLNILGPGVRRKMAHVQLGVATISVIPIITVIIAIITVVITIITVIVAIVTVIIPRHLELQDKIDRIKACSQNIVEQRHVNMQMHLYTFGQYIQ
jgi:hypothetical protein